MLYIILTDLFSEDTENKVKDGKRICRKVVKYIKNPVLSVTNCVLLPPYAK